jgi:membrane-bound lytic murein transglycosylase D
MAIQTRFGVPLTVLLALLAPGAFAPCAIASPWSEPTTAVALPAAFPTTVDSPRPDLLVEQLPDSVGSVAEQEAGSETEPAGIDPWADAFAESSRVSVVTVPSGSAYPLTVNPQVQYFLDRFTGARKEVVNLWVGRSGRYLTMIREVLRNRGLPEELAFTAMIESGFNPVAVSRMGAKGLWQFMAATARRYGMRVDLWIDERLDPEKSTVAAASYLRDLYAMFGSWTLAQAAYNAGENKVSAAIRATGSSDFWALARTSHLKPETKDFVPAIQAAMHIGKDPERYGFEFPEPPAHAVETVAVPPATDLRHLSTRSGIELETLRVLNPVLVRAVTPPGTAWHVRVPAGRRGDVVAALARPPARSRPANVGRVAALRSAHTEPSDEIHVVRPRDTLSSIAKQYGVAVRDVLRWNRLEAQAPIRPGDRIRIVSARPSVERDGQGGFR